MISDVVLQGFKGTLLRVIGPAGGLKMGPVGERIAVAKYDFWIRNGSVTNTNSSVTNTISGENL